MLPPGIPHHRALASIRARLLQWFDVHHRDLPWRRDRDPYRIWVSEVMLQQTTVAAVIPYFERFLAAFPSVEALAQADEQQVLKLWEGLGYYRRARHLHAAAKHLVSKFEGQLPDEPGVWKALPGVGPYILGAVLSQAFDRKLPIVEANSLRVLTRLFGYRGDPRQGEGRKWVWSVAEAVQPATRAGDFNQALMELGALICTPTAPACSQCPLKTHCAANRLDLQESIPPRKKPFALTTVDEIGVVIRNGRRVLLCQRPSNSDRWQNMWEVPHAPRQPGEESEAAVVRIARDLTGLLVVPGAEVMTIKHSVTRFSITLVCLEAKLQSGDFVPGFYSQEKWLLPADLDSYPVSSPQRKLMTELKSASRQKRLY